MGPVSNAEQRAELWTYERRENAAAAAAGRPNAPVVFAAPLPFALHPTKYTEDDEPWCVDGKYGGLDSLGYTKDEAWALKHMYGFVQAGWD